MRYISTLAARAAMIPLAKEFLTHRPAALPWGRVSTCELVPLGMRWWHMPEQPHPRPCPHPVVACVVGSTQAVWDPCLWGSPQGDPGCGAGANPSNPAVSPHSL